MKNESFANGFTLYFLLALVICFAGTAFAQYASSSVLSQGAWFKISVTEDGVYKIDKTFLKSAGVDVDNLDPTDINIYGNATGRLSEKNSDPFVDDLVKNAIIVSGESDGTFDDEDYILFYGFGPNRWDYNSTTGFSRNQHIYSTVNCYFIHIDGNDLPLRISQQNSSSASPTTILTSYDYHDIHEFETVSIFKGGQRWYGETFDGDLTQTISFAIPGLVSGAPLKLEYFAAASAETAGNSFTTALNGNTLETLGISSVGGGYVSRFGNTYTTSASSGNIAVTFTLNRVNPSVVGYLDYAEITARRSLLYQVSGFGFRDVTSAGAGQTNEYQISSSTQLSVWDVTNPRLPVGITTSFSSGQNVFRWSADVIREFYVFTASDYKTPAFVSAVENQDLHALDQADYLIVTHKNFLAGAERLANLHRDQGISVQVVTTEQVFNEFSSGVVDATAIKRFAKMFYDRAGSDASLKPKYLLLFGDGTYDPKNRVANNNYFMPVYEVLNSEGEITALLTDDYFGLLDDGESIGGNDDMDIGVGRLLISTTDHATQQVNKIEHYMKNGSQLFAGGPNDCCSGETGVTWGDWRSRYTVVTDDDDNGELFASSDGQQAVDTVEVLHPEMNYYKIYSDAYQQTSTAGGERYPGVFDDITAQVQRGNLIMNYIGHGGETGAASERIITIPQIQGWTNIDKLMLFVAATCEFTKFDDPSRVSAGEWMSLNPTGAAIAVMTTTRSIYKDINSLILKSLYHHAFDRETDFRPLAFGEIMRRVKNTSGNNDNRRCFTLIGDPALRIALPYYKIITDSVNHLDPALQADTIRALSHLTVKGHLEDYSGNLLTTFNGTLSPTVFDKEKTAYTLGQEMTPAFGFETRNNALYKGKATVSGGRFTFDCVVPKDINYAYGFGKISYYANSASDDGAGLDSRLIVGGIDTNALADVAGPVIDLYLNDDKFVSGSITSPTPLLVVKCSDESGINTVGNGVGHDLIAILDGKTAEPIVLNNYYTGDLDSYQSGKVQYTLPSMAAGSHTLDVKVWDVNNNSSSARLEFTVVDNAELALDHVLNYPNPFTTHTTFFFEHNQSCSTLDTQVTIYTVAGRVVRTINKTVNTAGFRVDGIEWDGKDEFGDQLAKGVYVYRLSVKMPDGANAEKVEKLVLLK